MGTLLGLGVLATSLMWAFYRWVCVQVRPDYDFFLMDAENTDLLTYCRFASQFLVCDSSVAFSICDVNPLQHLFTDIFYLFLPKVI